MSSIRTSRLQHVVWILLGCFMVYAGISHLTYRREEFLAEVPRWLSNDHAFMDFVVVASGIVEIILGLAVVFLKRYRITMGILLAVFFVLVFPGNISQYTNQINAFGLDTDSKRFIRLLFQPLLIFLALWSSGAIQAYVQRKH